MIRRLGMTMKIYSIESTRVWNTATGTCEKVFEGHSGWVNCLLALPNGKLLSGSADSTLKVWNVEEGLFIYLFISIDIRNM